MNTALCFCRLTAMRRRAGASFPKAMAWAAGLVYRNLRASQRQRL